MFCSRCGNQNNDSAQFCYNCGVALMYDGKPAASFVSQSAAKTTTVTNAGFWLRAVALCVDMLIISFIGSIPSQYMSATHFKEDSSILHLIGILAVFLSVMVVSFAYAPWFHSSKWQATPGKLIFGLKVVNEQQQRIGFWKAFWREMAKLLSLIPLGAGYIMAAFTEKKQALHDKMCGTLVIKK
jgi:uncharacterized RDD family membrane protein YckC